VLDGASAMGFCELDAAALRTFHRREPPFKGSLKKTGDEKYYEKQ
jgi:hypothetical protein